MDNSLDKKVRELEDAHFGEIEQQRADQFDQAAMIEAHRFAGALQAVTSIARSLTSKTIEGLMEVENRKYYLYWVNPATGEYFKSFAEYLASDEVPDLSKTKYYDLKALLAHEGAETFDVFSGKPLVPRATRRLLAAKGVAITVEGDELVIDDKRVAVTDKAAVKELVETMHDVLRDRDVREEKKDKHIEKLTAQLTTGTAELEELQRNLDAMRSGNPHDRSLGRVIVAMLEHTEAVGQLPDNKKAATGANVIPTLWAALQRIKAAYGTNYTFEDTNPALSDNELDAIARQVLADDDLEDDD